MTWRLVFAKAAQKDARKLSAAGLRDKAQVLLDILQVNPLQNPPPYQWPLGDLVVAYSRRINAQHRLVYAVNQEMHVVKVLRMWSHYE